MAALVGGFRTARVVNVAAGVFGMFGVTRNVSDALEGSIPILRSVTVSDASEWVVPSAPVSGWREFSAESAPWDDHAGVAASWHERTGAVRTWPRRTADTFDLIVYDAGGFDVRGGVWSER